MEVIKTAIIAIIVFIYLINIANSFGQQTNVTTHAMNDSYVSSNPLITKNDTTRPSVNITNPIYPPTITTNRIIINGTASDNGSGIFNVTAVAHTFPFKDTFPVPLASQPVPISTNNWSKWYVPFIINHTDSYRIVITAIDKAGNSQYAETTINTIIPYKKNDSTLKVLTPKIAFVRPTFTEAAYQENGFYTFYFKHGFPPLGKNITTDLNMLTVKTPESVSEFYENDIRYLSNITSLVPINGTELRDISQNNFPVTQKFWIPFINHVKKVIPDATLTVIRDEDVHDGHIFYQGNKTNAFDILLLFHNEYATQAEYDNLKQFVANGGTIVFIDANALYAEVRYDRNNDTISLVKGHDWEFNGKVAKRSVSERWYEENKDWIGSNFLINEIKENITFTNNPFNYTHFEEQFVNNPKAKIIIDYGVKFPKHYMELYLNKEKLPAELYREDIPIENITVASYLMDYGRGEVIMLGLSGRLLAENEKFLKFFDDYILPKSTCPKFESCTFLPITHYLYGCTDYKYVGYHCDPILNNFNSYSVLANYTKITSATREPSFVPAKFGEGVNTTGAHALESLRANILDAYDSERFSVYLSYMPHNYDDSIGNPYTTLVSYKNGIFKQDSNEAGWEMELIPNNKTYMKTMRFTVFDTSGVPRSSNDVDIPVGKFSELVGTFDGKNVRVFVNGILKSESQFPGNYSGHVNKNNFIRFGGDAYCSCYLANGIIDEIRYYNYSLDGDKVKQINSNTDVLGKGLIGYWKLNADLRDYSSFKNDMFYNTLIASMAFAPDGRLFFTEKNSGNIRIMNNNTILEKPFASFPNIHVDFEQGLLGIAIDGKFNENHFIYAYYNFRDKKDGSIYARIVRLTDMNNKGIDETVLLDRIPASSTGFHTGGALAFNKMDDKLYATIGDSIDARSAQNLSSLKGKTIRISRDGSIPGDNPFPNSPVYTLGHRNMYGIAFNDRGAGIVTEPGSALYDEINSQIKGANYGWRSMQGANMPPNPLANDSSIKPLRSYYVSENPTQVTYYDHDKYEELKNKFIVGSFRGDLYAYELSDDGKRLLEEIRINTATYPSKEVVATAVSPTGDIYFGAYDIYRLDQIDLKSQDEIMFPIQINATGVRVSKLDYSPDTEEVTMDLTKKYGFGSLSINVPKTILEDVPEGYGCYSKNASANQSINTEVPYQIVIHRYENNTILTIHLPDNAPENIRVILDTVQANSSKLNLCLLQGKNS